MTKTELLEAILAELKAIHALLEADDEPQSPAEQYEAMKATIKQQLEPPEITDMDGRIYNPFTDTWAFPPRKSNGNEAGRY